MNLPIPKKCPFCRTNLTWHNIGAGELYCIQCQYDPDLLSVQNSCYFIVINNEKLSRIDLVVDDFRLMIHYIWPSTKILKIIQSVTGTNDVLFHTDEAVQLDYQNGDAIRNKINLLLTFL